MKIRQRQANKTFRATPEKRKRPIRPGGNIVSSTSKLPLLPILRDHPKGLTPEELLGAAGYDLTEIDDFYEQRMVYSPDSVRYLYLSKSSIKKGEHILIVDDLIRSGITIDALVKLTEKAKARVVGIFTIASMEQSLPKLNERLNLNCPVESLVDLPHTQRHYNF